MKNTCANQSWCSPFVLRRAFLSPPHFSCPTQAIIGLRLSVRERTRLRFRMVLLSQLFQGNYQSSSPSPAMGRPLRRAIRPVKRVEPALLLKTHVSLPISTVRPANATSFGFAPSVPFRHLMRPDRPCVSGPSTGPAVIWSICLFTTRHLLWLSPRWDCCSQFHLAASLYEDHSEMIRRSPLTFVSRLPGVGGGLLPSAGSVAPGGSSRAGQTRRQVPSLLD